VLQIRVSDSLFCPEREVVQQINIQTPNLRRVEASISFGEILEQTNTFLRVRWLAGAGNRSVQLVPFSNAGCEGNAITFSPTEQAKPSLSLLPQEVLLCPGQATAQTISIQSTTADSIDVEVLGGSVASTSTTEIKLLWSAESNEKQLKVQAFTQLGCQSEIQTYRPETDLAACQDQLPLQIPNVVTRNGDGKNDLLQLGNIDFHRPVKLSLFNRWGTTVFQTNDYQNNWPTEAIPAGTYFLVVESGGKVWKGMVEVVK
jgi:gliding motility-associated-like protein